MVTHSIEVGDWLSWSRGAGFDWRIGYQDGAGLSREKFYMQSRSTTMLDLRYEILTDKNRRSFSRWTI